MKSRLLLICGWLACADSTQAQMACTLEDSEDSCRAKVTGQVKGQAETAAIATRDAAAASVVEGLAKAVTGSSVAGSPGAATTFSDFFSVLKAAVDSGSTGEDEEEAIGFEFSRCGRGEDVRSRVDVAAALDRTRLQCQIRVRAGGATLYEPIKNALPEAIRDARAQELENGLGFGDSLTAGVFLNLADERWGRVPQFTDRLFNDVWTVTLEDIEGGNAAAAAETNVYEDLRARAVARIKASQPVPPGEAPAAAPEPTEGITEEEAERLFSNTVKFSEVARVDPDLAARMVASYEAAVRAEWRSLIDLRDSLRSHHYFDLVDLVNNQPQLNFGVEYTNRDDLAGPDQWGAKLVWEYGRVNMNSLRDECDSSERVAAERVQCIDRYLNDPRTRKTLEAGDRFALSLELVERKKYSIELPTDSISIAEKSYRSAIASFAYGFYSAFDGVGDATSRLDFEANYEDVSDDPNRQNRGKATATFSHRVLGNMVLSISLVYATKPEFRGEVDEELSGRVGFNYKWKQQGML